MLVEWSKNGVCNVGGMVVENSPDHITLWKTNDLRAQGDSRSGEAGKVQDGPPRPSGAILEAGKGNLAA